MFLPFLNWGWIKHIVLIWNTLICKSSADVCVNVTVPMDLDVKMKAVMIGAVFLIVSTDQCSNTMQS